MKRDKSSHKKPPPKLAKKPHPKLAKKSSAKKSRPKSESKTMSQTTPKPSGSKKIIYLDNNGTTIICPDAENVYKHWLKCYNASSSSIISKCANAMMEKSKKYIIKHCGSTCKDYTVVFTSGATESNCFIIRSTVEAYRKIRKIKPHLIVSSIEHHSILECVKDIKEAGYSDVSYVEPNMYGCILVEDVEKLIKPSTCLISIIYANNETGSINNIPKIGEMAHKRGIPLHSDSVQLFGKYPLNLVKSNVDSISASFHKLYGPKGIGIIILKNDLIDGYDLKGQICGSQQGGLRGGTENIPAIASAVEGMKWNFKNRKVKNAKMLKMRNYIIDQITKSKVVKMGDYGSYLDESPHTENELVILGPPRDKPNYHLPNTLLMSIAKNKGSNFCNVKFKKELDKNGIVVSIASACLTTSDKASHVLTAIGAPPVIKRGVLRVSLGDYNNMDEIKIFVQKFIRILESHL